MVWMHTFAGLALMGYQEVDGRLELAKVGGQRLKTGQERRHAWRQHSFSHLMSSSTLSLSADFVVFCFSFKANLECWELDLALRLLPEWMILHRVEPFNLSWGAKLLGSVHKPTTFEEKRALKQTWTLLLPLGQPLTLHSLRFMFTSVCWSVGLIVLLPLLRFMDSVWTNCVTPQALWCGSALNLRASCLIQLLSTGSRSPVRGSSQVWCICFPMPRSLCSRAYQCDEARSDPWSPHAAARIVGGDTARARVHRVGAGENTFTGAWPCQREAWDVWCLPSGLSLSWLFPENSQTFYL